MSNLPAGVVRGKCVRLGWNKAGDRIQAVIEFYDGPPHWPLSALWKARPILLALEAETDDPHLRSLEEHKP